MNCDGVGNCTEEATSRIQGVKLSVEAEIEIDEMSIVGGETHRGVVGGVEPNKSGDPFRVSWATIVIGNKHIILQRRDSPR